MSYKSTQGFFRGLLGTLTALVVVGAGSAAWSAESSLTPRTRYVRCDQGRDLGQVLERAREGDVLSITGTCTGEVTITTDSLTLQGSGDAVLDGGGGVPTDFSGVITIDGARGVRVVGLTIQNGRGEGILGRRGAAFEVVDSTVQDNAHTGIAVAQGSTAELVGVVARRNFIGADVFTGSSAVLRGRVSLVENTFGLNCSAASACEVRGAELEVSDNALRGLSLNEGTLQVFSFPGSTPSTLRFERNGDAGMALAGSAFAMLGASSPPGAIAVVVRDNSGPGIALLTDSTVASPFGVATFQVEGNAAGLVLDGGSSAIFVGGLQVTGNGAGVVGSDSRITLVSIPPNPSSIVGNAAPFDIDLSFGSRSTIAGATVGPIQCDATVLSQGTATCPP